MKELTYEQKRKFLIEFIAIAPGDLRGLFSQYRISKPLNPENLSAAIVQFGPKFADRMYQIYSKVKGRNAKALALSGGSNTNDGLFGGGDLAEFLSEANEAANESLRTPGIVQEEEEEELGFFEKLDRSAFGNVLGQVTDLWTQVNISAGKSTPDLVDNPDPQNPSKTDPNSKKGFDWSFKNPIIKIGTAVIVLAVAAYVIKRVRG